MRSALSSLWLLSIVIVLTPSASQADFDLHGAVRTAAAGDTVRIPAGTYLAPLRIDRPLSLEAEGEVVIDAGGEGDVLRIDAPDVTIRGMTLRGSGDSLDGENAGIVVNRPRATIENCRIEDVLLGIIFRDADQSSARNNVIRGKPLSLGRRGDAMRLWNSHEVRIEGNTIAGCRDLVVWYSRGVHLLHNEVSDSRYGMHFMYAHDSVLEDNHLHHNSVGVFLMYSRDIRLHRNILSHNRGPSGYGIGLKDMDAVSAEDNLIVGNRVGLFADNSPQRIDEWNGFRRNHFAYNDVALALLPSVKRNRWSDNAFVENVSQISILGGGTLQGNEFTVDGRGNYWSDYQGFDADGDGIGDVPYRNTSLFEDLLDREPKLRLFLYGPAQQAVEFAARAFPLLRPPPRITDTAPLMRPALSAAAAGTPLPREPMSLFGLALLLGCGGLLAALRISFAPPPADPGKVSPPKPEKGILTSGTGFALLEVRDLRKRFGRVRAVDGVSFSLPAGQALALAGSNGAGKTTIIKCLLGLYRFQGDMSLGGLDIRRFGKLARLRVGYVSQEQAFDEDVSAQAVTAFFARIRGVALRRVGEVLSVVGLKEHATKRVGALSGGMKQRLALAVALLSDPPLLVLDEPTSNLDAAARRAFLELLAELKRAGKTILFTTHRTGEIAALADRVIVLEQGRILSDGVPRDLMHVDSPDVTLRLIIPPEQHHSALRALSSAGFTVEANCNSLHVRVRSRHKAEPIDLLSRAGITVRDFDIEKESTDRE